MNKLWEYSCQIHFMSHWTQLIKVLMLEMYVCERDKLFSEESTRTWGVFTFTFTVCSVAKLASMLPKLVTNIATFLPNRRLN